MRCLRDPRVHLGYMSFGWGAGTIVGPVAGGFLALPCDKTPGLLGALCHDGGLLSSFPYLLPCLLAAVSALSSFLAALMLLNETLPAERRWALFRPRCSIDGEAKYTALAQRHQPRKACKPRFAWLPGRHTNRVEDKVELVELRAACDSDASDKVLAGEDTFLIDEEELSWRHDHDAQPATAARDGCSSRAGGSPIAMLAEPEANATGHDVAHMPMLRRSIDASISLGHPEHSVCSSHEGAQHLGDTAKREAEEPGLLEQGACSSAHGSLSHVDGRPKRWYKDRRVLVACKLCIRCDT